MSKVPVDEFGVPEPLAMSKRSGLMRMAAHDLTLRKKTGHPPHSDLDTSSWLRCLEQPPSSSRSIFFSDDIPFPIALELAAAAAAANKNEEAT